MATLHMQLDFLVPKGPRFALVVALFGPPKSQNALKMGFVGTKNRSQMGPKSVSSKLILDHFGVPKQLKLAHFEAIASHFGHSKFTKCLQNGLFCDSFGTKNWSKMCFSKNDPRAFGVHKQMKNLCTPPPPAFFATSFCVGKSLSLHHDPINVC